MHVALLILGSTTAARAAVELIVDCQMLSENPEQLAEFRARSLVELSVRRAESGMLQLTCDSKQATLRWSTLDGSAATRVALPTDRALLVDGLIAALWQLQISSPQPPAAPPTPAPPVERTTALGFSGAPRAELWARPPNGFAGAQLALSLRGEAWSAMVFGTVAGAFEEVRGFQLRSQGGGLATDYRLGASLPLAIGIGASASQFIAEAPPEYSPRRAHGLSVATFARTRFIHEGSRFWLALGPEILFYAVRPRVLIADEPLSVAPALAGGFSVEIGWTFTASPKTHAAIRESSQF